MCSAIYAPAGCDLHLSTYDSTRTRSGCYLFLGEIVMRSEGKAKVSGEELTGIVAQLALCFREELVRSDLGCRCMELWSVDFWNLVCWFFLLFHPKYEYFTGWLDSVYVSCLPRHPPHPQLSPGHDFNLQMADPWLNRWDNHSAHKLPWDTLSSTRHKIQNPKRSTRYEQPCYLFRLQAHKLLNPLLYLSHTQLPYSLQGRPLWILLQRVFSSVHSVPDDGSWWRSGGESPGRESWHRSLWIG